MKSAPTSLIEIVAVLIRKGLRSLVSARSDESTALHSTLTPDIMCVLEYVESVCPGCDSGYGDWRLDGRPAMCLSAIRKPDGTLIGCDISPNKKIPIKWIHTWNLWGEFCETCQAVAQVCDENITMAQEHLVDASSSVHKGISQAPEDEHQECSNEPTGTGERKQLRVEPGQSDRGPSRLPRREPPSGVKDKLLRRASLQENPTQALTEATRNERAGSGKRGRGRRYFSDCAWNNGHEITGEQDGTVKEMKIGVAAFLTKRPQAVFVDSIRTCTDDGGFYDQAMGRQGEGYKPRGTETKAPEHHALDKRKRKADSLDESNVERAAARRRAHSEAQLKELGHWSSVQGHHHNTVANEKETPADVHGGELEMNNGRVGGSDLIWQSTRLPLWTYDRVDPDNVDGSGGVRPNGGFGFDLEI